MIQAHQQMNSLSFQLFLPHVLQPARVRSDSKTLIDYVFSNAIPPNIIFVNLVSSITDHLPQFLVAPNIFSNLLSSKLNIYKRDWQYLNRKTLSSTTFQLIGMRHVQIVMTCINPLKFFLISTRLICILYFQKIKFMDKPWITSGIQNQYPLKSTTSQNLLN